MVAALVLANALRALPVHSAIRRVPPNAPLVRRVLTRNWVKASAPHAAPVLMPINPVPAHAHHALLVITLWLARLRALSAHLARFRTRLGPSNVSCALKERTPTRRAHYRASNALLVPTILVQVPRHQSPAKFALKEPTTPRLEWETALHVSCVLLERTTAMPDQQSVNLAPEVHGARHWVPSRWLNVTSAQPVLTTLLRDLQALRSAKSVPLDKQALWAQHQRHYASRSVPLVSGLLPVLFHARIARQEHPQISRISKLPKPHANRVRKALTQERGRAHAPHVPQVPGATLLEQVGLKRVTNVLLERLAATKSADLRTVAKHAMPVVSVLAITSVSNARPEGTAVRRAERNASFALLEHTAHLPVLRLVINAYPAQLEQALSIKNQDMQTNA